MSGNDPVNIKFKIELGSVEPITFRRFSGNSMTSYCYSIHRDKDGVETHRTEPMQLGTLIWEQEVVKPFKDRVKKLGDKWLNKVKKIYE